MRKATMRVLDLMLFAAPALAAPLGKAGLWDVRQKGPGDDPMSEVTIKYCMRDGEMKANVPYTPFRPKCRAVDGRIAGNVYTAGLVCTIMGNAKGHIRCTFDAPGHMTCRYTFATNVNNYKTEMPPMTAEGKWVKTDCGFYK